MATFALQVGLTIRKGGRCWTFVRDFGDNTIQFEDIHTRAVTTFQAAELVRDIIDGRYEVLSPAPFAPALTHERASTGSGDALASLIGRLTGRQGREIERRERYVRAVIKSGIKPAARLEISSVVASVVQRFPDENPPSASTVIRWLRCFNNSEGNVLSLLSGNVRRAKAIRLGEITRDIAWEVLRQSYFVFRGKGVTAAYTRYLARLTQIEQQRGCRQIEPMSLSSFRRLVQSVPRYEADRVRMGATAANNRWRHAVGGVYATRPLERVEMDHTLLDLYVIDDRRGIPLGRPTLTLVIESSFLNLATSALGRIATVRRSTLNLTLRERRSSWRHGSENVTVGRRVPWNKGRLTGQKPPVNLGEIWAIRTRLQMASNVRELAMFNLAIDSKFRACDLTRLQVQDIRHGSNVAVRATVMQQKTQRPVQFEITEQTRESVEAWLEARGLKAADFLFPNRLHTSQHLSTRQYARIVHRRVASRRTKASLVYRRTKNLRAVQLLLGHTKLESTVRYLGIEVDDALEG